MFRKNHQKNHQKVPPKYNLAKFPRKNHSNQNDSMMKKKKKNL